MTAGLRLRHGQKSDQHLRKRSRLPAEGPIDATLHLESTTDPVEGAERRALVQRALR